MKPQPKTAEAEKRDIEQTLKRVQEAQQLIRSVIEPSTTTHAYKYSHWTCVSEAFEDHVHVHVGCVCRSRESHQSAQEE